jgi:putative hydrolase of the HAD superfamily
MIRAIIFDLDGTLLDRNASLKHFIKNQHKHRLCDQTKVPLAEYIKNFMEYDSNGYVPKVIVYEKLQNTYGWDETLSRHLCKDYQERFHEYCVPMSGLQELLQVLSSSDMKKGLITNGETLFQSQTIDALQIKEYFDSILISEREGIRKPEAEIFSRCLEQLKVKPEDAVYIGDHPENDIEAASKFGLKTIWIENDVYEEPDMADFTVGTLAQISNVIEKMNRRTTNENQ